MSRVAKRYVRFLLAAEGWMLCAALVWIPLERRRCSAIRRWIAGDRTVADAEAAWRNVVVELPRNTAILIGIVWVATVPAAALVPALLHVKWWFALVGLGGATLVEAGAVVVAYLFLEVAFAPVTREIAFVKPDAAAMQRRGVSISAKLLALPPVVGFYAVLLAGGLTRDSLGVAGRVGVAVGAAVAITVTISLACTLLLRRSLLAPVEALVDAADRVGAGDLDATVPPQSEDELGVLTHSFNRMLERLRAHDEELRESRARIVAAADDARRRVERDLHDGAQQQLVLLQLQLGSLERSMGDSPSLAAQAAELRAGLARALAELRDLAHGIYPAVLENEGLPGALVEAAHRAAIPTTVECDGTGRYSPDVEAAVYFCCLEALQNAAKHAGEGARAKVELGEHEDTLRFSVTDDGQGYEPASASSAGQQNMTDCIGALGGTLRVTSAPGQGTTVTGKLPTAA